VDLFLPYFRQWLVTCPMSAILPFQPLFTKSSLGDELLVPAPFSGALSPSHPLCCVLIFSSLFIVQFCFVFIFAGDGEWGVRSVCPGGYAGLSQGWLWEYCMIFGAHLFGLLNVSQAGLALLSGGAGALLFSQCNVACDAFHRLRVQGVEVPILLSALFPPSAVPASQPDSRVTELMLPAPAPRLPSLIST
jgi:hypothetical protein